MEITTGELKHDQSMIPALKGLSAKRWKRRECSREEAIKIREARGRAGGAVRGLHNLLHLLKHSSTCMADSTPRFGFVAFAETWNGRLAMLGFVIGLATELLTGQSILSQIGLG